MMTAKVEKAYKAFDKYNSVRYYDVDASGEHEMYHNMSHKKAWGRTGKALFKAIALDLGFIPVNYDYNKLGDIDRGYVSGFITNKDKSKYVYVQIADGMRDILYRTAKHDKDYTGGSNNTAQSDAFGFIRLMMFLQRELA